MNKKEKNDFLNRNEGFVIQSKKNRTGWEANIGENYSEFFLQGKKFTDNIELLKFGYKLVCQMLAVLTPEKVTVRFDNQNTSYTNGKIINVATEVFDEKKMEPAAKLDVFTGLAIHEGCHCIYTDFDMRGENDLIESINNLVEDERIEMNCGLDSPGLVNFLKKTKYYYFFQRIKEEESQAKTQNIPLEEVSKAIIAIMKLIRFPSVLTEEEKDTYKELLEKTVKILLSYGKGSKRLEGYPQSSAESLDAAKKIYNLLKKYMKEQSEHQNQQNENGNNQNESNNQSGSKNQNQDEQNDGDGQSSPNSNDGQNSQNGSSNSGRQSKSDDKQQNNPLEGLTPNQIENLLQQAGKMIDKFAAKKVISVPEQQQMKINKTSSKISLSDVVLGYVEQTGGLIPITIYDNMLPVNASLNNRYAQIVKQIAHYIPAMRNSIIANNTTFRCDMRSQRSGHFDHTKLVQGYLGSDALYRRFEEIKGGNANIAILVDMSGSMYGDKIERAQALATLMQESYSDVPNVNLFIYGHDSNAFHVFNEGKKSANISTMHAGANNYDSVAIGMVQKRVRKLTSEKVTFFVLSDGMPCERHEITKKAVDNCIKDNFDIISVGIDFNPDCNIYKHVVTYKDMNTFVPQFCRMVKKVIENATRR